MCEGISNSGELSVLCKNHYTTELYGKGEVSDGMVSVLYSRFSVKLKGQQN